MSRSLCWRQWSRTSPGPPTSSSMPALSLSKDLGPTHLGLETAFGAVKDHPELTVASVSQEHGVVRAAAATAIEGKFKVGEHVEIVPNHSCLTEAHFDEYVVIAGGRVIDRWHIERGR